jgi:hypothetical protein
MMKRILLTLTVLGLLVSHAMTQGYGYGRKASGQRGFAGGRGHYGGMFAFVSNLPWEELSEAEINGLFQMREEEKLARDVYLTLFEAWDHRVFTNIAQSEQQHMDAVKILLDKYALPDPVVDDTVGIFYDSQIQNLYNELVFAGEKSLSDALRVGATIEDLDIFDLKRLLENVDNSDVRTVYQNLMKGSRNHMRAFVSQLSAYGMAYEGEYLTPEEIDAIIDSPRERGFLDENGNPLYVRIGR